MVDEKMPSVILQFAVGIAFLTKYDNDMKWW